MPLVLMKAHIDNYRVGCIYNVPNGLRDKLVTSDLAVDYVEAKPEPVQKNETPRTKKRHKENRVKPKYETR